MRKLAERYVGTQITGYSLEKLRAMRAANGVGRPKSRRWCYDTSMPWIKQCVQVNAMAEKSYCYREGMGAPRG